MRGVDTSEAQPVFGADWFNQWDFVIMRAFNEFNRRDVNVDAMWANAAGRTRRGIYGWPVAGADNHALGRQLVAQFPDAEFGYWVDREHSGAGFATEREVEDYLRGIESMGAAGGFYSNIGECPRSAFLDARPWWMADYDKNDGVRHDPNESDPVPLRTWTIHQFTSRGGPGGTGLDVNFIPDSDFARLATLFSREDDMPKGFLAKTPDQPFVWFITPVGVRIATKNLEHQKLLQFFGHSSNGPNNVAQLSTPQLESYPLWEPEKK